MNSPNSCCNKIPGNCPLLLTEGSKVLEIELISASSSNSYDLECIDTS